MKPPSWLRRTALTFGGLSFAVAVIASGAGLAAADPNGARTPTAVQPSTLSCPIPAQADDKLLVIMKQVLDAARASDKVRLATFEAAWVESHVNDLDCGDNTSVGILQQRPDQGWVNAGDPRQAINDFLQGNPSDSTPGAIKVAAANPGWTPGQVAQKVQRSAYPDRYDAAKSTALALIERAERLDGGSSAATCKQPVRLFQLRSDGKGGSELWYSSISDPAAARPDYNNWRKIHRFTDKLAKAVAAHSTTKDGTYLYVTDNSGGLRQLRYEHKTGKIQQRWLHNADASSKDSDPYGYSRLTSTGDHLYGVKDGKLHLMAGLKNWQKPTSSRLVKTIGYPKAFYGNTGDANELGYTDGSLRYVNVSAEDSKTTTVRDSNWYRASITSPGAGMLLQFRTDGSLWRQFAGDTKAGSKTKISDHKTIATGTGTPDTPITTAPDNCRRG